MVPNWKVLQLREGIQLLGNRDRLGGTRGIVLEVDSVSIRSGIGNVSLVSRRIVEARRNLREARTGRTKVAKSGIHIGEGWWW